MFARIVLTVVGLAMISVGAAAQVKSVSPSDAKKIIDKQKTNVQVVDVRTSSEWGAGHLKAAKHIELGSATFDQKLGTLDRKKPVVVYCAAGGRSARAASLMVQKGFKVIYNVSDGGYAELAATGLPTTTK